jgi:hypothetical protein
MSETEEDQFLSQTEEQAAKDIMESKLGFSEEQADDTIYIAALIAAGSYWGAAAVAAYMLLDAWFSDGDGSDPLGRIVKLLDEMKTRSDAEEWADYVDGAQATATAIATIGSRASEFAKTPGIDSRNQLLEQLTPIDLALRAVLDGRHLRFMPFVYRDADGRNAPWINGRSGLFSVFDASRYNDKTHQFDGWVYKFEAYRDDVQQDAARWTLPPELQQSTAVARWDGLLSRKVALFGIPTWLSVLGLLDPFYQLTGYWRDALTAMRDKSQGFMRNWHDALLSTRDMPAPADAEQGLVPEAWVGSTIWTHGLPLPKGFTRWPCGALDPLMGVEVCSGNWWHSDRPEFMTATQRERFVQLRAGAWQRLLEDNGYNAFGRLCRTIDQRLLIPATSPSLAVHPELMGSVAPRAVAPIPRVKQVTVKDPGGMEWQGTASERSIHVKAPVSVQPNPKPESPRWPRAMTDTVFGYRISVTPKGGSEQSKPMWRWDLRLDPGGSSLYHEIVDDGAGHLQERPRQLPYEVSYPIQAKASTFVTITDGTLREQTDMRPNQPVTFTMTVRVCDQPVAKDDVVPFPAQTDPKRQLEQQIWIKQHGVIWIGISADAAANHGRSFDLDINITEVAAIHKVTGERLELSPGSTNPQLALENAAKTYTVHMPIPVDIATITVPTEYFAWPIRALVTMLHSYTDRKVKPKPDPPEVELMELRLILGQDAGKLRSFVEEYRRSTKRPSLTSDQALAEIDTVLAHVVRSDRAALLSSSRVPATTGTVKQGGRGVGLGAPIVLAGRLFKRLTGIR